MKKIFERSFIFAITISLLFFTAGCGTHNNENESIVSKYDAVYSNLVDAESQEILIDALKNTGISQASIDVLIDSINKYNDATGGILPVQKEFDISSKVIKPLYLVEIKQRR